MSSRDKLIQKVFAGGQVAYKDAETILNHLGFNCKVEGSHYTFRKKGYEKIVIKRRSQLLPYQIKDLQGVLLEHGYKKEQN